MRNISSLCFLVNCSVFNCPASSVVSLKSKFNRHLIRNTTQIAVINIFKIRILLNLTFRMYVDKHTKRYV